MKQVKFAEKSLLMGDDAADSLIEYGRALAETGQADSVTLRAIGADGNTVDATLLLSASSILMVESTNSAVDPPENDEVVRYLRERTDALMRPPALKPEQRDAEEDYDVAEIP